MTDGYVTITGATSSGNMYIPVTTSSNSWDYWEQRNQRISDELTRKLQRAEEMTDLNDRLEKLVNSYKEENMAFGLCEHGTKCHLCGATMVLREQSAETEYRDDGSIRFDTITNTVTYKCDTTVEKTTAQRFKKNKDTEPVISTKTYVGDGCIEVKSS